MYDILKYFPKRIAGPLQNIDMGTVQEIRMREGKPLAVKNATGIFFLDENAKLINDLKRAVITHSCDIENTVEMLCSHSVYAYADEIKNGFITTKEGHRAGICGNTVLNEGKVSFIKDITGLNFRVAHEIFGAADRVINAVYNNSHIKNTIIVSPPGMGKTTLLRDMTRQLSNKGKNISVVDERCEIAAMNSFDLGVFTDVLSGCPKEKGMLMMLRSMSPEIIVTDEIGTEADFIALEKALSCGVNIITTIHARNMYELRKRKDFSRIADMFNAFIVLSARKGAGTIEEIEIR